MKSNETTTTSNRIPPQPSIPLLTRRLALPGWRNGCKKAHHLVQRMQESTPLGVTKCSMHLSYMEKRSVLYTYYQGGARTLAKERSSSDRFPEVEERYSDYEVYDKNYQKIGKVDDLFVDENDQPEYIGVKMGFLGTTSTLIPVELVRVNDKRKLLEVAADKETVKGGPTFGDDRDITAEFERRGRRYYPGPTPPTPSSCSAR